MFSASLSTLKPHSLQTSGRIRHYILFMLVLFWTWNSCLPSQLTGFLFSQPVLSKQNVWLAVCSFSFQKTLQVSPCYSLPQTVRGNKPLQRKFTTSGSWGKNSVQSNETIKNRKVKKASCLMTPSKNSLKKKKKPHHAWVHIPALIRRGCVCACSVVSDSSRPHGL